MTTVVLIGGSEKVAAMSKLWWVGLVAAAAACVTNAIVYALTQVALGGPVVMPLQPGTTPTAMPFLTVMLASAIPALGASLLLAALGKFTGRPVTIFLAVSVAFLLLSLGGPLTLPISGGMQLALELMHVGAAVSTVGVLVTLGRHSG